MAKEIQVAGLVTATNYYAIARNASGQYIYGDGSVADTYNPAHWTNYAIGAGSPATLTEFGSTGSYWADVSGTNFTLTTAQFNVEIRQRIGGSAATTDPVVAIGALPLVNLVNTATNVTNAPTNGDFTATMKTSITAAVPTAAAIAAAVWAIATATLNAAGTIGKWIIDKIDTTISSRLAAADYTVPPSLSDINNTVVDLLASGITVTAEGQYDTVYYVRIDGSDGSNGTSPSTAFATFGKACSVAGARDLIVVGPGEFTESTSITIPCTVVGAGQTATIVENSLIGNCFFSDNAALEDLTLASIDDSGATNWALTLQNASVTMRRATVRSITGGMLCSATAPNSIFIDAEDCEFLVEPVSGCGGQAVAVTNSGELVENYRRCRLIADGGGNSNTGGIAYYNGGAEARFYDCTLHAYGCDNNNTASDTEQGTTWFMRSQVIAEGANAKAAVSLSNGGVNIMADTVFDPDISDNYTVVPLPTILDETGLDAIPVSDPGGVASMNTLPKMLVALWRLGYKGTELNKQTGAFKTFADNGTTPNTSATVADNAASQTKGAAS